MIIVKLMGGLGNQMFQYALGKHLAVKHNTKLKLDLTFLLDRTPRPNFTYRNYELGIFNITASFANERELADFQSVYWSNRLKQKIFHYYSFVEQQFDFDDKVLKVPQNTYLEGYWQSERYFKPIETIIRKDFSFSFPLNYEIGLFSEQIESKNSVCINVRRGDFVNNQVANKFHGVCDMNYFNDAVKLIVNKISNPHFYIFSDDTTWCKENFKHLNFPCTVVEHQYAGKNFENYLYLMIKCKHFIIPNSSFGWWGAWLNSNIDKMVIAPKVFFAEAAINPEDRYPEKWIII